jgi:predicted enzyme related to lactoylglutathione lyase
VEQFRGTPPPTEYWTLTTEYFLHFPMSDSAPAVGAISWFDLTVPDAVRVRDFYAAVVGWKFEGVGMDGYQDFCMQRPADGTTVAGVCHARGENANLPPVWLLYVTVKDVAASARKVVELGGTVVAPVREAGGGKMCVIRDPAGAVLALYEASKDTA